jgi:hypothetical protein
MSKTCPECSLRDAPSWSVDGDADLADVLSHYLIEHPESDRLSDVIDGSYVAQVCDDCQSGFWAVASVGQSGERAEITTEAYCPDCGGEGVRQLIVRTVPPAKYVANYGEPFDDDLNEVYDA